MVARLHKLAKLTYVHGIHLWSKATFFRFLILKSYKMHIQLVLRNPFGVIKKSVLFKMSCCAQTQALLRGSRPYGHISL